MNKKIILAVILVTGFAAGASAQSIRGYAYNEHNRIEQGYNNGSLTRGETRRLSYEQQNIRHDIYRARSNDGYISPRERGYIRREERYASRNIYRARHNDRYGCR